MPKRGLSSCFIWILPTISGKERGSSVRQMISERASCTALSSASAPRSCRRRRPRRAYPHHVEPRHRGGYHEANRRPDGRRRHHLDDPGTHHLSGDLHDLERQVAAAEPSRNLRDTRYHLLKNSLTKGSTGALRSIRFCQGKAGAAGWSSPVARWAHNPKVRGSNPLPATKDIKGLSVRLNPLFFSPALKCPIRNHGGHRFPAMIFRNFNFFQVFFPKTERNLRKICLKL